MIDANKIIDISMDLNEKTVVWTADPKPKLIPILRQPKDQCNFTWLDFGAHAGTHVDAPYYLFADKWTSDKIPFDRLIGRCQVIDMTGVNDMITDVDFKNIKITTHIVLIKTKNSYNEMISYNPAHIAMTSSAAQYLMDQGVYTIGFDYQSFERDGKNELHGLLMARDVISIDNLRLAQTEQGEYNFICLPIKVTGIDAGPARAILVTD
jgi:arylformamidase